MEMLSSAPLLYAEQYLEISLALRGRRVFGIGERRDTLLIDPSRGWTSTTLWNCGHLPQVSYAFIV